MRLLSRWYVRKENFLKVRAGLQNICPHKRIEVEWAEGTRGRRIMCANCGKMNYADYYAPMIGVPREWLMFHRDTSEIYLDDYKQERVDHEWDGHKGVKVIETYIKKTPEEITKDDEWYIKANKEFNKLTKKVHKKNGT